MPEGNSNVIVDGTSGTDVRVVYEIVELEGVDVVRGLEDSDADGVVSE